MSGDHNRYCSANSSMEEGMNTCDMCKHWDKSDSKWRSALKDVGRCKKAVVWWEASEWSEDGEDVLKPEYKDNGMFVQDGSDYRAVLYTLPNFGCVKWENWK